MPNIFLVNLHNYFRVWDFALFFYLQYWCICLIKKAEWTAEMISSGAGVLCPTVRDHGVFLLELRSPQGEE